MTITITSRRLYRNSEWWRVAVKITVRWSEGITRRTRYNNADTFTCMHKSHGKNMLY
jgi:hypothetical protein